MTKKGPLGTAEIFYIEQHCYSQDLDAICKALDRAKGLVEVCAEHYKRSNPPPPKPKAHNAINQMAQGNGATIQTQSSTEMADEIRKQHRKSGGRVRPSCVTTIKRPE
jgi:hypothetical protein